MHYESKKSSHIVQGFRADALQKPQKILYRASSRKRRTISDKKSHSSCTRLWLPIVAYGDFNYALFLVTLFGVGLFGVVLLGLAEIIRLLNDNRRILASIAQGNDYETSNSGANTIDEELPEL